MSVREGTLIWMASPPVLPPHAGGQDRDVLVEQGQTPGPLPACGEGQGGGLPACREGQGGGVLRPIDGLRTGDLVLGHDGRPHRVQAVARRHYRGLLVGIQPSGEPAQLWLTGNHLLLTRPRPRSLGGNADWSAVPLAHRGRRKELRSAASPPERRLWQLLRGCALGSKFRRQHPIGPYIADFYSRDASLVVEVDGAWAHDGEERVAYDRCRDAFLSSLGLRILRVPAREVLQDLEGVREMIKAALEEARKPERAEWMKAGELHRGDTVFAGLERVGVQVLSVSRERASAEMYDLEVEGAHSCITSVCIVHDRGGI